MLSTVWGGAKYIVQPFLVLVLVFVTARAVAWFVKARRGY